MKEKIMSKKLFITTLIVALPFAVSCDNQNTERVNPAGTGDVQQEEEIESSQAEVIDRQSTVVDREAADLQERQVEEGTEQVEYKTKQQVTETVLREQEIPTVQICRTKANINEMDKEDFQALGFDQQAADKIVQTREQRGQFQSVEELSQIQGVSPDSFSRVQGDLGVVERQAQEE
jgi:DNA uptake protein ComE-like DNA-binding protein